MTSVSMRELRSNLKHYLDLVEQGEELQIIRKSNVIGYMSPSKSKSKTKKPTKAVRFRRFGAHEDPQVLGISGPFEDLEKFNGEFWVGELDGKVVTMGGFKLHLGEFAQDNEAEVKHIHVVPELQPQVTGTNILKILESRAIERGYSSLHLDTTSEQTWLQELYEQLGYSEVGRAQDGPIELTYYRKQL